MLHLHLSHHVTSLHTRLLSQLMPTVARIRPPSCAPRGTKDDNAPSSPNWGAQSGSSSGSSCPAAQEGAANGTGTQGAKRSLQQARGMARELGGTSGWGTARERA